MKYLSLVVSIELWTLIVLSFGINRLGVVRKVEEAKELIRSRQSKKGRQYNGKNVK